MQQVRKPGSAISDIISSVISYERICFCFYINLPMSKSYLIQFQHMKTNHCSYTAQPKGKHILLYVITSEMALPGFRKQALPFQLNI